MRRARRLPALVVLGAAGVVGWSVTQTANPTSAHDRASTSSGPAPATATIVRTDLVARIVLDAIVGYAGSDAIVDPTSLSSPGSTTSSSPPVVTALPAVGQVIGQGETVFAVDGTPTVLLYGSTPPWRTLTEGISGADVAELNADLIALGDATAAQLDPAGDTYSTVTAAAVQKLQAAIGSPPTGTLTLGQAAFESGPVRITGISATLGRPVPTSGPVLTATSTTRLVTATIDAAQRSLIHAGASVTITLADGTTTPGRVTSIGADASEPGGDTPPDSPPAPPVVAVTIGPTDPAATGTVDQAPVDVAVAVAAVPAALAVPVAALATITGGRPAIDVLDRGGRPHLVAVNVGICDDTRGLVQVSGPGIDAGETIALPGRPGPDRPT